MSIKTATRTAANDDTDRRDPIEGRSQSEVRKPLPEAFSYRIQDACTMIGIGRTSLYALVKTDKLKMVKVAGRSLIDGDSLRALIRAA